MSSQPFTPSAKDAGRSVRSSFLDWFDARVGIRSILHNVLHEPIPGVPEVPGAVSTTETAAV